METSSILTAILMQMRAINLWCQSYLLTWSLLVSFSLSDPHPIHDYASLSPQIYWTHALVRHARLWSLPLIGRYSQEPAKAVTHQDTLSCIAPP